jgi:hypothetical protein
MDQLVSAITEKTGLPGDKVQEVVGMVVDFIADKLPGPIDDQVRGFVDGGGGDSDGGGGLMDQAKKGLGGLLGG